MTLRKVGFTTPVDEWFRGDLRPLAESRLLDAGSACRTYFDAGTIRSMLDQRASGRHDFKRSLFSLLRFELWHEEFIAAPAPAAVAAAN